MADAHKAARRRDRSLVRSSLTAAAAGWTGIFAFAALQHLWLARYDAVYLLAAIEAAGWGAMVLVDHFERRAALSA